MASGGSRPCCSPRRNPPLIDPMEDELARDPGPVGGPHSVSTSPNSSRNPTPGPDQLPDLISAPAPVPNLAPAPTNELFKKFMKAYLESNQGPRQPPEERKQTFKPKVPKMYYGKLHIDCYHFCQQCENHFETAGVTGFNQTLLQLLLSVRTLVCAGHSSNVATEVRN